MENIYGQDMKIVFIVKFGKDSLRSQIVSLWSVAKTPGETYFAFKIRRISSRRNGGKGGGERERRT